HRACLFLSQCRLGAFPDRCSTLAARGGLDRAYACHAAIPEACSHLGRHLAHTNPRAACCAGGAGCAGQRRYLRLDGPSSWYHADLDKCVVSIPSCGATSSVLSESASFGGPFSTPRRCSPFRAC